jgi:hypothetical protein
MPLLPEKRGWHIVRARWLDSGAAVQRELRTPRASHDTENTPTPECNLIDAALAHHDNHSELSATRVPAADQTNPRRRAHLVGTVPQTGVLMVTHKRNMRSKFR